MLSIEAIQVIKWGCILPFQQ